MTDTQSSDDLKDRAMRAVRNFNKELPSIRSFVRAVARDDRLAVQIVQGGAPRTDGKTVFLPVPIEFGDKLDHVRGLCGQLDTVTEGLKCPACARREDLFIDLFHEVAHVFYDTFEPPSPDRVRVVVEDFYRKMDTERGRKLTERAVSAVTTSSNYLGVGAAVSSYMPMLVNAVEDVRVNGMTMKARPGTRRMFQAKMSAALLNGNAQLDGTVRRWSEAPVNAQAIIAYYLLAHQGEHLLEAALPEVAEVIGNDDELRALAAANRDIVATSDNTAAFGLALKVLERLRELGFCLDPDDPEDSPEEPEEDEDDQPEEPEDQDEPNFGDPDEEQEGHGEADPESDSDNSKSDDDESDESDEPSGESGESDKSESAGGESQDDKSEDSDDGESSGGESSPEDDDTADSGEAGGEPDANDEPEEGDADAEGDSDGEAPDGDEAETADGDSESEGQGASSDEDADADGEAGGADDGDDPEAGESPSESDAGGTEGSAGGDEVATEGGSDRTSGPITAEEQAEAGTPDEASKWVEAFSGHGSEDDEGDDGDGDGPSDEEVDEAMKAEEAERREGEAIAKALGAFRNFDAPSIFIDELRVAKRSDDPAFSGMRPLDGWAAAERSSMYNQPAEVNPTLLNVNTQAARRTFAANRKGGVQGNLRKGTGIDPRKLGQRIPTGDDRIFMRRSRPKRKSFFVLIGLDISGSTSHMGNYLINDIKSMAAAKAEMLRRLGIPFAMFAHAAVEAAGGIQLLMHEIKSPSEPWGDTHRKALDDLYSIGGNLDGHTMEFYRKVLEKRSETDRVLLYFTDGEMPASNYQEELAVLQRELKTLDNMGVKVLGVGCQTDSPTKHGLETVRFDGQEDMSKVLEALRRELDKP